MCGSKQGENIMLENTRIFEQTELTALVLRALSWAVYDSRLPQDSYDQMSDLIQKIEQNKLDVRLVPRDE